MGDTSGLQGTSGTPIHTIGAGTSQASHGSGDGTRDLVNGAVTSTEEDAAKSVFFLQSHSLLLLTILSLILM